MMLICDICTAAYELYPQHEKVCNMYATKVGMQPNDIFKPQICYPCARRINEVAKKCFCTPISEE